MSTDTVIEVNDLRVDYGTTTAVDGTSFTVRRGEVFALLGTNGAGKTTTLDVLEGYREATAGAASVFGVDPLRNRDRLAPRIGIMLQDAGFFETLTVRQTVTAWRRFYRGPRSLDEAVGLVGLSHRVDTRVSSLSGGERRRLDLALALLGHPELLFLDEPTTGMDPEGRHQSLELVAGLVREGLTVVLTTHYLEEAEQLADRVAIMHRGTIRRMGTLEAVRAESGDARIGFEVATEIAPLLPATLLASVDHRHGSARVEVRDPDPERVLRLLFAWADAHDVAMLGLEVRRGSLEDVFLSLPDEPDDIGRMPGTAPPGGGSRGRPPFDGDRTMAADIRAGQGARESDDDRSARVSVIPAWPRYVWPQVVLSQRVYWQDIAFALVGAVMPIAMGIFPMVQVRDAPLLSGGIRPIDLLAPSGLCVSIIWIAYAVINSAARRRETRTYKRLRATPIPQSAILVGEATSAALPALAQSGIVLAIAVGYFKVAPPIHWTLVVVGLVIGAITMGLLTFGVSGLLPSSELSTWIVTPFVIGMWILSGSLTVTSGAVSTIDRISDYLPSTAFVQIVRTGYVGQDFVNHDLLSHPQLSLPQAVDAIHQPLGVLILWIAVGYLLFRTCFKWEPRTSRRRGRVTQGTRGNRSVTGTGG